jgi:AI-2 transport protein TqsA
MQELMLPERTDENSGARFLLMLASGVVVVWGLQFAAPVILPSALALFLAVLSLPIVVGLTRRRVPRAVAIFGAMLVVVGIFTVLVLAASRSLAELQGQLFVYVGRLQALRDRWLMALSDRFGVSFQELIDFDLINPEALAAFLGGTVAQAASLLSTAFLVLLVMVFFLAEATVFPQKLQYLLEGSARGEERMNKVVAEIQSYLGIKTVISLATGLLLGVWCWVMGLDFPVLLGLIAFVLNYVPTVGSILAGIPAVLLSLILVGTLGHALVVTAGYVVVNTVFGNIIEPNLMGRRLGLSPLVVMLSLLFWGWTWGPVGALLSVPLTMVLKIWLENTRDLRWVAVLLDRTVPAIESETPTVASEAGSVSGASAALASPPHSEPL